MDTCRKRALEDSLALPSRDGVACHALERNRLNRPSEMLAYKFITLRPGCRRRQVGEEVGDGGIDVVIDQRHGVVVSCCCVSYSSRVRCVERVRHLTKPRHLLDNLRCRSSLSTLSLPTHNLQVCHHGLSPSTTPASTLPFAVYFSVIRLWRHLNLLFR